MSQRVPNRAPVVSSVAANELPASAPDCIHDVVRSFLVACVLLAPMMGISGLVIHGTWRDEENRRVADYEASHAYEKLVASPAGPTLAVADAAHGRDLFAGACVSCHGANARGVQGLGRNLVESNFVARQNDETLKQFLVTGRPEAKPVPMPPKGGHPELTEGDLRHIVAYIRGIQDPRRMPELPLMAAPVIAAPTVADQAKALAAAGGDKELAGYIAHGQKIFASTCAACHGASGEGVKGNGKMLTNNAFITSLDDEALLAFLKKGRDPSDPKNTTGVGMPAKGGNPALSEDDLLDVITYLRTLQPNTSRAAK